MLKFKYEIDAWRKGSPYDDSNGPLVISNDDEDHEDNICITLSEIEIVVCKSDLKKLLEKL